MRSRFTAPQTLAQSSTDQVLLGLANSPSGETVAVWGQTPHNGTNLQGTVSHLNAAEAPPGAQFGAPQPVPGSGLGSISLAVDPRTGNAIATWGGTYVVGRVGS